MPLDTTARRARRRPWSSNDACALPAPSLPALKVPGSAARVRPCPPLARPLDRDAPSRSHVRLREPPRADPNPVAAATSSPPSLAALGLAPSALPRGGARVGWFAGDLRRRARSVPGALRRRAAIQQAGRALAREAAHPRGALRSRHAPALLEHLPHDQQSAVRGRPSITMRAHPRGRPRSQRWSSPTPADSETRGCRRRARRNRPAGDTMPEVEVRSQSSSVVLEEHAHG